MGEAQPVQRSAQFSRGQGEREFLERNPLLSQNRVQGELDIMSNSRVPVLGQWALYRQILSETPPLKRVVSDYFHQSPKRSASRFFSVLSIVKHRLDEDTLQSINRFVGHFADSVSAPG